MRYQGITFLWRFGLFLCLSAAYQVIILFKAIRNATDLESEDPHLSGMSVITLEGVGLQLFMNYDAVFIYKQ